MQPDKCEAGKSSGGSGSQGRGLVLMMSAVGAANVCTTTRFCWFLSACLLPNYKIILMNAAGEGKAAERQEEEGEEEG